MQHCHIGTQTSELPDLDCIWCFSCVVQSHHGVALERVEVLLARLQAVQELSVDQIISLLGAAVDARLHQAVHKFCQLPAAQQITSATAFSLLQRAVQKSSAEMATAICHDMSDQLGERLTAPQVASLLKAALEYYDRGDYFPYLAATRKLKALVALPAAADIDAVAVAHLLQAAVESAKRTCSIKQLKALATLPGAAAIEAAAVVNLFQAAVEGAKTPGSPQQLKVLAALPGAAALDATTISSLIGAVLSSAGDRACRKDVEALVALQGARSIGACAAGDLILKAAMQSRYKEADMLLQLPAAQHLQQQQFMQLLDTAEAAGPGAKSTVLALLRLPAAQHIDSHHVMKLAEMVFRGDTDSLQAYLTAHIAQQLAQPHGHLADSVLSGLVQTAAAARLWLSVKALCETLPAAQLGIHVLVDVLSSAMSEAVRDHEGMPSERSTYQVITVLLDKTEARQLPAQHLESLLLTAAAGGYHTQDHMRKLLQLPAAQELASNTLTAAIRKLIDISDAQRWARHTVVGELLSLDAAGSIASDELSSLFELAVSRKDWQSAAKLIRLQAADLFVTTDMLLTTALGLLHDFHDAMSGALVIALQELDLTGLREIVQWVAKRRNSLALWNGNNAVRFRSDLMAQVSQLSAQQAANIGQIARPSTAKV